MRSRISFGWQPLETILQEPNIRELLVNYWTELSPVKHLPLDPNWDLMLEWDRQLIYRVWVCRVDGTMAGFVSFFVQPHFLHRTTLFAVDAGHYLSPAYRDTNARLGWRMWKSARAALIEAGAKVMYAHDNARRPLMPFFLALGLEPLSTMWVGRLDEDTEP